MKSFLIFLISFAFVYFSCPFWRKLAFRFKILDIPGGRKIHKSPTALLGGAAVYLGVFFGVLLNSLFHLPGIPFLGPIMIGASIILLVGLANDIKGLSVHLRLLGQVVASLVIIIAGARVSFLPNLWWGQIIEIIVTLIWLVGLTNAYNYLDGLDGLAAGSAIINLLSFIAVLYISGQYSLGILSIALIATCLGFLPYNFSKRKIFLGEAGSTFLGFTLASIALVGYWAKDSMVKISIPVLILGVPIFDMIFTSVMRVRDAKVKSVREWLEYSGKDHFHHYLVDLGLRPSEAVVFIYFITLSLGISAVMVSNDPVLDALLAITQSFIIFGTIATLIVVGRRFRSGWS